MYRISRLIPSILFIFLIFIPAYATYYEYWNVTGLAFPTRVGIVEPRSDHELVRAIWNQSYVDDTGITKFKLFSPSGYVFKVAGFPAVSMEFGLDYIMHDNPNNVSGGIIPFPVLHIVHDDKKSVWWLRLRFTFYTDMSMQNISKMEVSGAAAKIRFINGTEVYEEYGVYVRTVYFNNTLPLDTTRIYITVNPRFYYTFTLNISNYYSGYGNTSMMNFSVGYYFTWKVESGSIVYEEKMVLAFPLIGVDEMKRISYVIQEARGWTVWAGLGYVEYPRYMQYETVSGEEAQMKVYYLRVWDLAPDINLLLQDLQAQVETGQPGDIIQPIQNVSYVENIDIGKGIYATVFAYMPLMFSWFIAMYMRKDEDIALLIAPLMAIPILLFTGSLTLPVLAAIGIATVYILFSRQSS